MGGHPNYEEQCAGPDEQGEPTDPGAVVVLTLPVGFRREYALEVVKGAVTQTGENEDKPSDAKAEFEMADSARLLTREAFVKMLEEAAHNRLEVLDAYCSGEPSEGWEKRLAEAIWRRLVSGE